ncbi:unnamed protein product, partial [Mycena citricolor]
YPPRVFFPIESQRIHLHPSGDGSTLDLPTTRPVSHGHPERSPNLESFLGARFAGRHIRNAALSNVLPKLPR